VLDEPGVLAAGSVLEELVVGEGAGFGVMLFLWLFICCVEYVTSPSNWLSSMMNGLNFQCSNVPMFHFFQLFILGVNPRSRKH